MSLREGKILSLTGVNCENKTQKGVQNMFNRILNNGMHGLCFSPYEEGQEPGSLITEEQIRRRMEIISPYTKWIRSFSCTEGNELIPRIAHEFGIKTLVGAWLGKDEKLNRIEIDNLIQLAKEGIVDIAAVGNEVLYRNELSETSLLTYIDEVKEKIPGVPVGYVDAYYEFVNKPKLKDACDVLLINCYPFWEGCHADYSLLYMKEMYNQVLRVSEGKKIVITETGWPSLGENFEAAHPSYDNAKRYFINTQQWGVQDNIDIFYFSSFDESWKVGAEGDVGAYWGLWDKDEKLKF